MFNKSQEQKNAERIGKNLEAEVRKEENRTRIEKEKRERAEKRVTSTEKRKREKEKEQLAREAYSSNEQKKRETIAKEKYADKVRKRKEQRLANDDSTINRNQKENKLGNIAKKSGYITDEPNTPNDKENKKPIGKKLFSKLSYANNKKWIEDKINNGSSDRGLTKYAHNLAKLVTNNKNAKLNTASIVQLIPQVRVAIIIATIIFTFVIWIIMFLPLIIAIFGVVVILLNQDELGIDLGVDVDVGNIASSSKGSGSSNDNMTDSEAKFGNASKVTSPKNVDWVFPLSTPNEMVEYNGGYAPRSGYNGYSFHYGIDMGCNWLMNIERNVYAVEDGVVDWVHHGCPNALGSQYRRNQCSSKYPGGYGTYGNLVRIHHEKDNLWSLYAHLEPGSNSNLKVGSKVKKGQVIGLCGDSGGSWGHHLHFEVWKDGRLGNAQNTIIDPHPYIGLQWARERRVPALNRYNIHGK